MNRGRLKYLPALMLCAVLLLIFCSCIDLGSADITDSAFYEVSQAYFDMVDIEYDTDDEETTSVTCSVICASSLFEYTASMELLDKDGNKVYESEKQTVSKGMLSNKEFKITFEINNEYCKSSTSYRLSISGRSFSNPKSILNKDYTVTYIYNGETVKTETVKGGERISTSGISRENLIFNGWYHNESLTISASAQSPILRDTTYYARMSLDAEAVTNEITTDTIKSLVSISYKERTVSGLSVTVTLKTGSGVIFHTDNNYAYILTNHHVVDTSSNTAFTVTDYRGTEYVGYIYTNPYNDGLKAICEENDLACMYFAMEKGKELPSITLAKEELRVGESCISLGYPNAQKNAITYGTVLEEVNLTTPIEIEAIKHSALVEHGCSGGPLLNARLELVGINYAKQGKEDGFSNGYTIPLHLVKDFIREYTPFSDILE